MGIRDRRYDMVAFDVDGTLIDSADGRVVWQLLNEHFGEGPEVNGARLRAYLRKEITYSQWVDLDVRQWVEAGATRAQMEQAIRGHLHLVPGVQETVAKLSQAGLCLVVISGTLDMTLDLLLPHHPFAEVHTNRIWFDDGGRIAGWEATPYDMEGKARALREMARRRTIPLPRTVYVGDNINDLGVMAEAGLAVAYRPKHRSVAEAADVVIEQDLREILRILL